VTQKRQDVNDGEIRAFGHEPALIERSYNSSLRYDWTNLPPMTPLGKILEQSSSKCTSKRFLEQHGPQELVYFEMIPSGLGSSLHTWMNPLCHASANGKVLITGSTDKFKKPWLWNDEVRCRPEFEKQKSVSMGYEYQRRGSSSALGCYFGWHATSLRCPPGTLAWNKTIVNHNSVWQRYQCHDYHQRYGRSGVLSAVAEWLFQNVSKIVVDEAERQIREEAFPVATLPGSGKALTHPNQRWPELPSPEDLITVHIRWGDKAREMELVEVAEYIDASKILLTEEERVGTKPVHFYVATEDPRAVVAFQQHAEDHWVVHSSGPFIRNNAGNVGMMDTAYNSKGNAGLQSLGALLIAMEANRYILTTGSNWSRLINELRKSVLDSRCGNCTKMIDLREGEL